ncbi:hypothetical protein [Myxacorys almedinensis]|uniref:Uncharacterized protein n=1 Tax=Myxacorys almedinensis A TaxID=2690445 RepID=A0A8J7Z0T2_9CYAN|nr:hypothetical protein [Myxacorys almedinensis]NDJ18177.1 hypothetical protein [Myxacorys almedinensis A]
MRSLLKLVGFGLLLLGLYFLGQNVIVATQGSVYWWRGIPATGSVLAVMSGVFTVLFARSSAKQWGWLLIGLGMILAFLSGGIVLKPMSLWAFSLAFASFAGGYKLMTTGRI